MRQSFGRGLRWLALTALIGGCAAQPTGPSLGPNGQTAATANRVVAGNLQGTQVGPTTRAAVVGYFANASGIKLDAFGQPTTDDIVVSVPVKDGKYGINLPIPPSGPSNSPTPAVRGRFGLMIFNDTNGNNRLDPGEASLVIPESDTSITYQPFAGYSVIRNAVTSTDPSYFTGINLTFN